MNSNNTIKSSNHWNAEQSTIKNDTKGNKIQINMDKTITVNPKDHESNQIKDDKKIKYINQRIGSERRVKKDVSSHTKNEIKKSSSSHRVNKIHKLSRPTTKKIATDVNKIVRTRTNNSDSFYTGAIVGSFLGAVISSAITKFLTEAT